MSNWQYHNPVEIHFGIGIIKNLPDFVTSHKSVLITTPGSTKRGVSESLKKLLGNSLVAIYDDVQPNPTFSSARKAFMNLQPFEYEIIIALGGGSAIDTAKAVAAIGASGSEVWIDNHLKHGASFSERFAPETDHGCPHYRRHRQRSHHVGNNLGYGGKEKVFY